MCFETIRRRRRTIRYVNNSRSLSMAQQKIYRWWFGQKYRYILGLNANCDNFSKVQINLKECSFKILEKIRVGNETKKIFALFLQWPTKELPNWPLKKSMPNLKRMIWQLWRNPGEVVMQLWDQLLENRVFHQGANLGKKYISNFAV